MNIRASRTMAEHYLELEPYSIELVALQPKDKLMVRMYEGNHSPVRYVDVSSFKQENPRKFDEIMADIQRINAKYAKKQ